MSVLQSGSSGANLHRMVGAKRHLMTEALRQGGGEEPSGADEREGLLPKHHVYIELETPIASPVREVAAVFCQYSLLSFFLLRLNGYKPSIKG